MSARKKIATDRVFEPDVVAWVERTEPAHAPGMQALVGIGMGVRQGEPIDGMRLDFELSCGTASMRINGGDFVVSLASCHVLLALENGDVRPHSRYEHQLVVGAVESIATETHDRSDSRKVGAGIEIAVDALPKPKLLAKLFGRANRTITAGAAAREVTKRQSRIDLVVVAGQDRWLVGEPGRGDGRRSDGRLLGTYFGEGRDEDDEPKALCVVSARNQNETSTMTVSTVVRFGQFLVHLGSDLATPSQREDVDVTLTKQSRQVAASHGRRAAELRARVAGLVLAKAMLEAPLEHGLPVPGEILIARQSLTVAGRGTMRPARTQP